MRAREIINKLPENVLLKVNQYREAYTHFDGLNRAEARVRMAGYVEGLRDAGLITERERQTVYVYMTVAPTNKA